MGTPCSDDLHALEPAGSRRSRGGPESSRTARSGVLNAASASIISSIPRVPSRAAAPRFSQDANRSPAAASHRYGRIRAAPPGRPNDFT